MSTSILPSSQASMSWATNFQQRRLFLVIVVAIHLVMLIAVGQWHPSNHSSKSEVNSLLIQWLPKLVALDVQEAKTAESKPRQENQIRDREPRPSTHSSAQNKPAKQTPPVEESRETPQAPAEAKALDPFAPSAPAITDQLRLQAGKAYKQIEAEHPIKRWLITKKELTPIEKFARDALGATPAREIQTQEEMRPDGSRMTRVKTPRGEFCVVGPTPGRPYDIKGPEHRVMSCPIYF